MDALPSKHVRLSGLKKASHLNGKLGTVMSYDAESGRYAVSIDGGDGVLVKLANLEPVANICALPTEVLSRIACLMACPVTMSRASRACRLLREQCADGAIDRGYQLGYDEFALGHEEFSDDEDLADPNPGRVGREAMTKPIFHLFRLHVAPQTARLPPSIDEVESGSAALHMLRTDFAHFQPRLCLRLTLPEKLDCQTNAHGLAEYANAAALFSLAGVADVSIPAIQAMIEGAWAEGMNREGAEHFGRKLVGKSGKHACIGATDVLVALWHKRCNAFLIQIMQGAFSVQALRRMVAVLYNDDPSRPARPWVQLPLFLQMEGSSCSCLVVGVTTGIEEALLVADLIFGGIRMIKDDELPNQGFRLLAITGSGPSPDATLSTILEAAGQNQGAAKIVPAAAFHLRHWCLSEVFPGRQWLVPRPGLDI